MGLPINVMRPIKHDKKKQKKLEFAGFAASWFEDDDVLSDLNNVHRKIETTIDKSAGPPPEQPPEGVGES